MLGIHRAVLYYEPRKLNCRDQVMMKLIDEEYTKHPFYGARRLQLFLKNKGYSVGRKHVGTLMRKMGIEAVYPKPNLSWRHPEHKVYPYLLRGLAITEPNQVWSTDITYIRMKEGFAYLVAIMDWHSRRVLSWRLSNTLEVDFCVEALEEAFAKYGKPEIFNTDQGSQFTSEKFISKLVGKEVTISMDGRGRAYDNIFIERLWRTVKYEDIYLKGYANIKETREGLKEYFEFYNEERFHQSLGNKTPGEIYRKEEKAASICIRENKPEQIVNMENAVWA